MVFQKDPEKQKAKEEAARIRNEAREANRLAQERARAEAAFRESPQGQARAARESEQAFFQIALPISETTRTVASVLTGDPSTTTRVAGGQTHVLQAIEGEGWRLEHIGYVFQETGIVSRDKLLSSGQTGQVTGQIVGIYLFRAEDATQRQRPPLR